MHPLLITAPPFVFFLARARLPQFSVPKSMADNHEHQHRNPAAGAVAEARRRSIKIALGVVTAITVIVACLLEFFVTQVGGRQTDGHGGSS